MIGWKPTQKQGKAILSSLFQRQLLLHQWVKWHLLIHCLQGMFPTTQLNANCKLQMNACDTVSIFNCCVMVLFFLGAWSGDMGGGGGKVR